MKWFIPALLSLTPLSPAFANSREETLRWQTSVDLDGDGRPEKIRLSPIGNRQLGGFRLWVNDQSISSSLSDRVLGFRIVNINKGDRFKEICVHADTASYDASIDEVFSFNRKNLHSSGKFDGGITFLGNGKIHFYNHIGIWASTETWMLDARHVLKKQVPAFYPVNLPATTNKPIFLFDKSLHKHVVTLPTNRKITIVKATPDYTRYYVEAKTGESGWVPTAIIENALHYDFPQYG